ncbi:MAG TPA: arginine--tRNA ligase [Acidimicrobiales bacterium]
MPQTLLSELGERLAQAARSAFGDGVALPATLVLPARDARHGDYSSPAAMSLAKTLGQPPLDVAAQLVAALQVEDLCEPPTVVAPGFVNLRLLDGWLGDRVASGSLVAVQATIPERVVVDYSGPNVAKQMHVGHLRSTIIGDTLANVLEARGHRVDRLNHLGDWGAQFGMLLTHLADSADEGALDIADVEAFYRAANQRDKDDPAFHERARQAVVALQSGETVARARWAELVDQTQRNNRPVYELLGIRGLVDRGESFYQPLLGAVVDDLARKGLLVDDQGAKVVFVDGFTNREGDPLPLIIQNQHGGFGYAVTDLAALRHRLTELGADRVLYVVDAGQSQHLDMVFAVARAAGWVPAGAEVVHVSFGLVLGEDGKRLRTRSGENVSLGELLAEAVDRSRDFVLARAEERAEPPPDDLDGVARAIGIGAVKYADLSQNRQSNYVFSFDRMLSLKGNTAPYLQYAHARIRSILRTAASEAAGANALVGDMVLGDPSERELAKLLVGTADVVARVADDYEPNHLCGHLFEVAQAFSRFYEACPVLKAEDRLRRSRLALCGATADVLRDGLALLGIEVVERL